MPLTDETIRRAKPGAKSWKIADQGGLFILVQPSGSKLWRFKYRFEGKENAIALGVYPAVGIDEARRKRDEARHLLAQGIDPSQIRRLEKARDKSEHLAEMDGSTVKVSVSINGTVEIWKGRAVMLLSPDEARAVKALLVKLTK